MARVEVPAIPSFAKQATAASSNRCRWSARFPVGRPGIRRIDGIDGIERSDFDARAGAVGRDSRGMIQI